MFITLVLLLLHDTTFHYGRRSKTRIVIEAFYKYFQFFTVYYFILITFFF